MFVNVYLGSKVTSWRTETIFLNWAHNLTPNKNERNQQTNAEALLIKQITRACTCGQSILSTIPLANVIANHHRYHRGFWIYFNIQNSQNCLLQELSREEGNILHRKT